MNNRKNPPNDVQNFNVTFLRAQTSKLGGVIHMFVKLQVNIFRRSKGNMMLINSLVYPRCEDTSILTITFLNAIKTRS